MKLHNPSHPSEILLNYYLDSPSFVVLDNGHIVYKGVEYLNHKRIIYSIDFIKSYFLNINW